MALSASMRILIVDDMSAMLKIIKGTLKAMGFTNIYEGSDGKEALEVLTTQKELGEPIEFIISDWNMPEMSGLELLRACRADDALKNIPFLMLTAEADRDQVVVAIKEGVSNYMIKPFTPDILKQKISNIFK